MLFDKSKIIMWKRAAIFFFMSLSFCIVACSPRIVERVKTEYVSETVHRRDTVIKRDSIYLHEWMKGDTIYIEKYRDRYIYRDRWRDSIQIREVHDTTTVEVKVEKELSVMQKAKQDAFWGLVLAVVFLLIWVFRKQLVSIVR